MHCILFGNPAILNIKDPLALRRRITPVLPFRRHLFVVFSPSTIDGLGVFQRRQPLASQKNAHFVAEMSISLALKAKKLHFLRQPGHPYSEGPVGFASPDYSGFALSVILFFFQNYVTEQ